MQCTRCAGLRVSEIIYEGGSRVLALRCVHCGDVIDPIIILNRHRRSLTSKPKTSPDAYLRKRSVEEESPRNGLTLKR